jgi:hypothetical protein
VSKREKLDQSKLTQSETMDEKYTGLIYAMASSLLIGVSFIITKISLIESAKRLGGMSVSLVVILLCTGPVGDNYAYLQNWRWWLGMITSKNKKGVLVSGVGRSE